MFLLVPAHRGSPGQRAIKWLCVYRAKTRFCISAMHRLRYKILVSARISDTVTMPVLTESKNCVLFIYKRTG